MKHASTLKAVKKIEVIKNNSLQQLKQANNEYLVDLYLRKLNRCDLAIYRLNLLMQKEISQFYKLQ